MKELTEQKINIIKEIGVKTSLLVLIRILMEDKDQPAVRKLAQGVQAAHAMTMRKQWKDRESFIDLKK